MICYFDSNTIASRLSVLFQSSTFRLFDHAPETAFGAHRPLNHQASPPPGLPSHQSHCSRLALALAGHRRHLSHRSVPGLLTLSTHPHPNPMNDMAVCSAVFKHFAEDRECSANSTSYIGMHSACRQHPEEQSSYQLLETGTRPKQPQGP